MRNKRTFCYSILLILAVVSYLPLQAQESQSKAPQSIVRTLRQDRKGNMWMASWEGIFKYDGKTFANITSKVSQARFFSVLEDRKGNFWFASIGSGVYYFNGKSFRHFTTKNGLANDRVTNIYEDKAGHVWFGTEVGASRYDGKSFRNFVMTKDVSVPQADSVHISVYEQQLPENHWMHNDVNAVVEDKAGNLWVGTRGYAFVYDGKEFTKITDEAGKPFVNIRTIIKDRKGNIWLGGKDGLWRYDNKIFKNFSRKFVGYIYEDKKGNIWTSSESAPDNNWVLSRYDEKSFSNKEPSVTEIKADDKMLFGISEAHDGSIWFGGLKGVYRYDGKAVTDFKMN